MDAPAFTLSKDELKSLIKDAVSQALEEYKNGTENKGTFLNIQEAAALLNLAVNTIYEKTSERTIPFYKHGKKILFKKSELLAFLETRKVKTIHQIRHDADKRRR